MIILHKPGSRHTPLLPFAAFSRASRVPFCLLLMLTAAPTTLAAKPRETPLPATSLYQVQTVWTRDDGKTLRLDELRGKPRVLTMFFSRCDNICPMLTGQLKVLEREMPPALRARTGFVLVTLDAAEDDAETLAEHRRRMGYSRENWVLLRGSPDETRELAHLLGVTYKPKAENGQIDHDGLIVILDAEGRILHKAGGITDRKAFLGLLKNAVEGGRR